MPRSSNFSEAQKAALYVLHRATCVYSGANLWILDGGATPSFIIDWADHVTPVSKGGLSEIKNGVCSAWHQNFKKRDSSTVPQFHFYKGKPTKSYLKKNKIPRKRIIEIQRFNLLHHSDWYFNRALFRLLLGVDYLHNGKGIRTRDDKYYAAAALKAITKWRKLSDRDNVPSLEQRNLAPRRPSKDQSILLSVRNVKSVAEIRSIMKRLLTIYRARSDSEL